MNIAKDKRKCERKNCNCTVFTCKQLAIRGVYIYCCCCTRKEPVCRGCKDKKVNYDPIHDDRTWCEDHWTHFEDECI